jgi:hypothetical protein
MGGLGRFPSTEDERDYRLAALVSALEEGTAATKVWASDRVLDQGDEPACVGFAFAGWGICLPTASDYTNADGHAIYRECKAIDGDDRDGTTVRTGAKAMKRRGRIAHYYFADSVHEAADFVCRFGSIVLGINWYEGFNTPDESGVIHLSGEKCGGHCILWIGVVVMNGELHAVLRNSWSEKWGFGGDCYLPLSELEAVFADEGEAAAATEVLTPVARRATAWQSLKAACWGWLQTLTRRPVWR